MTDEVDVNDTWENRDNIKVAAGERIGYYGERKRNQVSMMIVRT